MSAIGEVLAAIDDPAVPFLQLLGTTQVAVAGAVPTRDPADTARARALLAELGWSVQDDSPLLGSLDRVLRALAELGRPTDARPLLPWARAARRVAEHEIGTLPLDAGRDITAEAVAVGTVLYGELLSGLRLLAQEAVSTDRLTASGSARPTSCYGAGRGSSSVACGASSSPSSFCAS